MPFAFQVTYEGGRPPIDHPLFDERKAPLQNISEGHIGIGYEIDTPREDGWDWGHPPQG
jgi:hypothetical protein